MTEVVVGEDESGNAIGNLVCDLDGVVYRGGVAIPGAARALAALTARGYRILFASNNSTQTPATMARSVTARTGFATTPDQVITSSAAAAHLLRNETGPLFAVGEAGLRQTLSDAGLMLTGNGAEAVAVVVGMDRHFDYETLRAAAAAVRRGARFVATNTDATFPTATGFDPGGGAMVAAIAVASGREPDVAGKPHAPIRRLIEARLGSGPTFVVGDRPETDLALGVVAGWSTVLVLSGVTSDAADVAAEYAPDLVLESIAELPDHLP